MADIQDLSIVDASNTARFPENQAPSTVNDGARALEGIVARWHKDTNGSKASTGSANAYIFAADQTLSAYYDGLMICFDANFTNTGAATLNVDAVSADAIVWPDGTALAAGDIPSGAKVTVVHDGTSFQVLSSAKPLDQANQAALEAETNEDAYVPPDLIKYNPGVAKVWVKFDLAGTVNASRNVSSVTDTGTGDWTVNLTTSFSSVDYSVVSGWRDDSAGVGNESMTRIGAQAVGSFQFLLKESGTAADPAAADDMHAIAFGDQ